MVHQLLDYALHAAQQQFISVTQAHRQPEDGVTGRPGEWGPHKRAHAAQICGGYPDALARCAQLVEDNAAVDFVDINMGCPIDLICNRRAARAARVQSRPGTALTPVAAEATHVSNAGLWGARAEPRRRRADICCSRGDAGRRGAGARARRC